nr:keratin, type I cytoskeletal 9-like [Aegilops tauschii subsp. strangulata]
MRVSARERWARLRAPCRALQDRGDSSGGRRGGPRPRRGRSLVAGAGGTRGASGAAGAGSGKAGGEQWGAACERSGRAVADGPNADGGTGEWASRQRWRCRPASVRARAVAGEQGCALAGLVRTTSTGPTESGHGGGEQGEAGGVHARGRCGAGARWQGRECGTGAGACAGVELRDDGAAGERARPRRSVRATR